MIFVVVVFIVGLSSFVQSQLLNQEEFILQAGNWLGEKAEQILQETVAEHVHVKWFDEPNKADDDWVKVLTHEAFPEYEIKLKEPKLCDPTVKQVRFSKRKNFK